jgi:hypothetical protein
MITPEKLLATKLVSLTAEAQDLYPDHTFKASMWHVDRLPSVEEKCEELEKGLEEFRRGLAR